MKGEPDVTLMLADSDNERRFIPQRVTRGVAQDRCMCVRLRPTISAQQLASPARRRRPASGTGGLGRRARSVGMLLPSTAGRADDRLRTALPFAPETFGICPSTEVGDHLDAAAESLGQRRDCGTPHRRPLRQHVCVWAGHLSHGEVRVGRGTPVLSVQASGRYGPRGAPIPTRTRSAERPALQFSPRGGRLY
jgi:hypothetical protein